jgi:predicted permease
MPWEILLKVLPVFFIIGVGFVAGKFWKITEDLIKFLTKMILFIFLPSLIFVSSLNTELGHSTLYIIIAAMFIVLAMGVISLFVSRYLKLTNRRRSGFMLSTMFMNAGSMGTSVALFAFGTDAFLIAVIFYITVQMLLYTIGVVIASDATLSLKKLKPVLSMPLIYALLFGLALHDTRLGEGVAIAPLQMIGAAAVPLLLVTLGMQISMVKVSATAVRLPALGTALRIAVGFSLALVFVTLIGIGGLERNVLLISASMPTAISTFVIGLRFDTDSSFLSNQILLSTSIAMISTPIILWGVTY